MISGSGYHCKETLYSVSLHGGDDGNRTHVRKPLGLTFFVDSLLFEIPPPEREQTRSPSK